MAAVTVYQEIDNTLQTLSSQSRPEQQIERKTNTEYREPLSTVNAEYLVQLPSNATPENKIKIYTLIMTFAFPMSTNPVNRAYINKTLTNDEIKCLKNTEMYFLEDKINKEIVEGVKLIPIPKTLYQLYVATHVFSQNFAYPNFVCPDNNQYKDARFFQMATKADIQVDFERLVKDIQVQQYQDLWWKVNNELLDAFANVSSLHTGDPFVEVFDLLVDKGVDRLVQELQSKRNRSRLDGIPYVKNLLKKVILEEALEYKFYLLYCKDGVNHGSLFIPNTEPNTEPNTDSEEPLYFVDGLFTSLIYDPEYSPIQQFITISITIRENLYAYSLDKNKYLSQDDKSQNDKPGNDKPQKPTFYIPPFPRMLNVLLRTWFCFNELPEYLGDRKMLNKTYLQELLPIESSGAELQKARNFYQQLQECTYAVLPPALTAIIFQYGVSPRGLSDFVVCENSNKGLSNVKC